MGLQKQNLVNILKEVKMLGQLNFLKLVINQYVAYCLLPAFISILARDVRG